jgi:hypothetical protein
MMRERFTSQSKLISERPERWAPLQMDPLAARVLANEQSRDRRIRALPLEGE